MKSPLYIKKILCSILVLIFALSITPKQFLHDAFAGHTDSSCKKNSHHPLNATTAGYHCNNDDFVAELCFLPGQETFIIPARIFVPYITPGSIAYFSAYSVYSPLRGPPALI